MPTAYPPINRYSTLFELSDFKNSLKSLASAGVAIEGPSQEFERPQSLLDRPGQPVFNRVVPISQAHDGKLRAVQPELLDPILRRHNDNSSLPPNQWCACPSFAASRDRRCGAWARGIRRAFFGGAPGRRTGRLFSCKYSHQSTKCSAPFWRRTRLTTACSTPRCGPPG